MYKIGDVICWPGKDHIAQGKVEAFWWDGTRVIYKCREILPSGRLADTQSDVFFETGSWKCGDNEPSETD